MSDDIKYGLIIWAIIIVLLAFVAWVYHDCDVRAKALGAVSGRFTRDIGCLAVYPDGTLRKVE